AVGTEADDAAPVVVGLRQGNGAGDAGDAGGVLGCSGGNHSQDPGSNGGDALGRGDGDMTSGLDQLADAGDDAGQERPGQLDVLCGPLSDGMPKLTEFREGGLAVRAGGFMSPPMNGRTVRDELEEVFGAVAAGQRVPASWGHRLSSRARATSTLARLSRPLTAGTVTPRISAISAYVRPSTSRSSNGTRCAGVSRSMAFAIT